MSGMTNRGKYLRDDAYFRGATPPTKFYLALCTAAVAPNPDTNVLGDLTEIAAGNGYTAGGQQVNRNATDFDSLVENDGNDRDELQLKDFSWTAVAGPLPASGAGARWAALVDDNATPANRQVIAYWDLASDRAVSSGQTMTLQNCELRTTE